MSLGNKNWQHLIGGGGGQQLVVGNKCDTLGGISRDRQDSSCFVYPLSLALFVSFFACMQVVGTYGGHLYTLLYFSSHGHNCGFTSKIHTHLNLRVALSWVVEICRALKRIVEFRRILLRTVNEALCGASCSKKPAGTRMVDQAVVGCTNKLLYSGFKIQKLNRLS